MTRLLRTLGPSLMSGLMSGRMSGRMSAPLVWPGGTVLAGDTAGWLHDTDDPSVTPGELRLTHPGLVVARRMPAMAKQGDTLFTTALSQAA